MKVAVLGLGSAGMRHARILIELGHEVIGFDPARPADVDEIDMADSFDSAIATADAVVVASPNALHAQQAIRALEGQRHVLVEKPLAVSAADAERVVAASERSGVVCAVAMNLRFHPGIRELKRLVDSGALGDVLLARASFGYDLRLWHPDSDYRRSYSARADLGGGIVLDAIHELDYLLWIFGPVSSVSAEVAHVSALELETDVEDLALAALRFSSGALGALDLNFFEPAYRRGCVVVGSDAVAEWTWADARVTVSRRNEPASTIDAVCDLADTYRWELLDFVDAIEKDRRPETSAQEGLDAVRLAETLKSAAEKGERLFVGAPRTRD